MRSTVESICSFGIIPPCSKVIELGFVIVFPALEEEAVAVNRLGDDASFSSIMEFIGIFPKFDFLSLLIHTHFDDEAIIWCIIFLIIHVER